MTDFLCTQIQPNMIYLMLPLLIIAMLAAYSWQNKFGLGKAFGALMTSKGSMFRKEPDLKRSWANIVFFAWLVLIPPVIILSDFSMCAAT